MATDVSTTDKMFDRVSKICTIMIPIVLAVFGYLINKSQKEDTESKQQAQSNEAKMQHNYDRVATLLPLLSSDKAMERKLAIRYSQGLATTDNFPKELIPVIFEVTNTDSVNSKGAVDVLNTISENAAAKKDTQAMESLNNAVKNSPSKVYMQVPVGYDMAYAKSILNQLNGEGYIMLGIEKVNKTRSPSNNEVRYFKQEDASKAKALAESLGTKLGSPVTAKLIGGYENKVIVPLEIWIMK